MVASNTGGASRDQRLPEEVVDDLLGSDRRRYALQALSRREAAMTVDDLAAVVCACERETAPEAIDSDERQQVRDEFFQRHLPKLTATNVVRYDSMLGTVELADRKSLDDALDET